MHGNRRNTWIYVEGWTTTIFGGPISLRVFLSIRFLFAADIRMFAGVVDLEEL